MRFLRTEGDYARDSGSKSDALMPDNTIPWKNNPEATET